VKWLRAQRILRAYSEHYLRARAAFGDTPSSGPNGISVTVERPGHAGRNFDLRSPYPALIDRVRREVAEQLELSKCCSFFPPLKPGEVPPRTADIPTVRRGEVIAIQLNDPFKIGGLEDLCEFLIPQLERNVYGSHVIVDKVYAYRNLVADRAEEVSWLWHYDNHPREILKLMIYLTDVDEESGPFEYLRCAGTAEAVRMTPRPLLGNSRLSTRFLKRHIESGCRPHRVTGPAGTLILFDNNIAHKANLARKRHRDVVTFQIRPCDHPAAHALDVRWTGSFQHEDFNRSPGDYTARIRRRSGY
jgi:hypothetical protein